VEGEGGRHVCDDLSHRILFVFLDFMLHVLWFSSLKSKGQVISHMMHYVHLSGDSAAD
jgi:hypothetical protein